MPFVALIVFVILLVLAAKAGRAVGVYCRWRLMFPTGPRRDAVRMAWLALLNRI